MESTRHASRSRHRRPAPHDGARPLPRACQAGGPTATTTSEVRPVHPTGDGQRRRGVGGPAAKHRDFDSVIDSIYDAAADPLAWEVAIRATADLVSAGAGVLFGQSIRCRQVFWGYETRSDLACLRVYAEHYMHNPWSLHMDGRTVGEVVFSDEAVRTGDLLRSGFWHDVLRPQDINHNAMIALARHGSFTAAFNLCRTPRQGPYGEQQRAVLRQLVPHLRRACQLHMRLDGYSALRTAEFAVLEQLANGVVVLDHTGVVQFANRAARRLDATGGPMLLRDGTIRAVRPDQSAALLALVRAALRGSSGGVVELTGSVPDHGCLAIVAPLRGTVVGALFEKGLRAGGAVVFIAGKPSGDQAAAVLAQLYGLTPAETRVAFRLGQGEAAPAIANTLGISVNTVKTHTRHIFEKAGVNRQAEFAGLVARLQPFDLGVVQSGNEDPSPT